MIKEKEFLDQGITLTDIQTFKESATRVVATEVCKFLSKSDEVAINITRILQNLHCSTMIFNKIHESKGVTKIHSGGGTIHQICHAHI